MDTPTLFERVAEKVVATGPHVNRGPALLIVSTVFTVAAIITVVMRLLLRLRQKSFGYDDSFIIIATVASVLQLAIIAWSMPLNVRIKMVSHGYGQPSKYLAKSDVKLVSLGAFIWTIIYKNITWPTKASILFMYLRIFSSPTMRAWGMRFRYLVIAFLFIVLAFLGAGLVISVFACIPVQKSWMPKTPGHCVLRTPWWYAYGTINVVTDVVIFLLPLPLVKDLQIKGKQKLAVMMVFGLGLFVIVVSAVRMTTLSPTVKNTDPTLSSVSTYEWSIVESNVGIICASLPMVRNLLASYFPRVFGTTQSHGQYHSYPSRYASHMPSGKMESNISSRDRKWTSGHVKAAPAITLTSIGRGNGERLPSLSGSDEQLARKPPQGITTTKDVTVTYARAEHYGDTYSMASDEGRREPSHGL